MPAGQRYALPLLCWPMRGSVPASRRRMLAWWRAYTSTAIANASLTAPGSASDWARKIVPLYAQH